jgi:hypothetical protein
MLRGRRCISHKAIDQNVGHDINHQFLGGTLTVQIPAKCQEFLRNHKQVICADQRIRFMALDGIRKEVIAGKADNWEVVDFDFHTGEGTLACVYCMTGVEHPSDGAYPVNPPSSAL